MTQRRWPRGRRVLSGVVAGLGATAVATFAAAAVVTATTVPAVAAPTGQIRSEFAAMAVPGSYLVVFQNSTMSAAGVSGEATRLTRRYGGVVRQTWTAAVRGFELAGNATTAREIAANPAVSYVEQNQVYAAVATEFGAPWGLDRIDQRQLPLNGRYIYTSTAPNVHAYIIDTGIRLTHVDFGGRASSGFDFVDNDTNASDCNGHGTHVAGTIGGNTYGVAKRVALVAVRVLNCSGSGTTASVVAGVNWVTLHAIRPAVANMSLGGGPSSTLDAAVRNSIARGITYAIAAGNSGTSACTASPARVATALTVAATGADDARPFWSNYGSCVDIFAPGLSIRSDWYTSNTATNTLSGTSMATPHVAGVVALILSGHPGYTPAQVTATLIGTATLYVVYNAGAGTPNRLLYVG
jgi:subtilisin family serine protease